MNPADPKFLVSIDETTTLGQLQLVLACLDAELRGMRFLGGLFHVTVASQGEIADAAAPTLGKAIGVAIDRIRFKIAAAIARDLPPMTVRR